MEVKIDIDDSLLEHYSNAAKTEVSKQAKGLLDDLVTEASRIEAGRRLQNSDSEVTQSDVLAVIMNSKILKSKKKQSNWMKFLKFFAIVVTWFSGWLFKTDKFSTTNWFLYSFLVCLIIAVGLNVYFIFIEDGK